MLAILAVPPNNGLMPSQQFRQPTATTRKRWASGAPLGKHEQSFWIFRSVAENNSIGDFRFVARRLKTAGSARDVGTIALSLMDSDEFNTALRTSPINGLIGIDRVLKHLTEEAPEELHLGRRLETTELGQFGEWVGIGVVYPEFIESRQRLITAFNHLTHTNYRWRKRNEAYIRLELGDLGRVPKERVSQLILPSYVTLEPANFGQAAV